MASPSERTLSEPLDVIRLHDPRFDALDPSGARLHGGRWNSPGADVVYAALSYAGAILEVRVHANVRIPPPRAIAVITIPAGARVSELRSGAVPGWEDAGQSASRSAGDAWLAGGQSVALIVPAKAGAPFERNIVINLRHADATRLSVEPRGVVPWDARLFAVPEHDVPTRIKKKRPLPRRKK